MKKSGVKFEDLVFLNDKEKSKNIYFNCLKRKEQLKNINFKKDKKYFIFEGNYKSKLKSKWILF